MISIGWMRLMFYWVAHGYSLPCILIVLQEIKQKNGVMSCHSHWWWYNLITKQCLNISSTSVLHKLDHLVIRLRIRLQRMKDNCWICSGNWDSYQRLTKGWMMEQTHWCCNRNKARPQQQRDSSSCHLVKHSMSLSSLGAAQARRQRQAMTYGSMKSAVLWWTSHCGGWGEAAHVCQSLVCVCQSLMRNLFLRRYCWCWKGHGTGFSLLVTLMGQWTLNTIVTIKCSERFPLVFITTGMFIIIFMWGLFVSMTTVSYTHLTLPTNHRV